MIFDKSWNYYKHILLAGLAMLLLTTSVPAQADGDLNTLELEVEPIITGITLPITIKDPNDGTGLLYVVQQEGQIMIYNGTEVLPDPFLDISSLTQIDELEEGLMEVEFHPDYATNGYFYIYYTGVETDPAIIERDIFVVRYQRSAADPLKADPDSAKIILQLHYPTPQHHAGQMHFGPDGFLYIATGDGSNPCFFLPAVRQVLRIYRSLSTVGQARTIPRKISIACLEKSCASMWTAAIRTPFRPTIHL